MDEPIKKLAVGWLCRLNSKNARALAIQSVQKFAETHFGRRLTETELRKLSGVLCEINDTAAMYEAIQAVLSPNRRNKHSSKEQLCSAPVTGDQQQLIAM